jgi:predicted small lipoprotein YifL
MHRRPRIVLVLLLIAATVTACGQKGPLYLPSEQDGEQTRSR